MTNDKINDYINTHPREFLRLLLIGLCLIWQSPVAVLALGLYFLLIRLINVQRWMVCGLGAVLALEVIYLNSHSFALKDCAILLQHGFKLNYVFLKLLFADKWASAFSFLYHYQFNFVAGFPLLMAGFLSLIDLVPNSPHENVMKALQQGIYSDEVKEVKPRVIDKALKNLNEENFNGTVLGVSKYDGQYVVVPDRHINQVALVLGTTGGGKTITLRRFYQRAIKCGYPLIIVDGKPDDSNIAWLMSLASQYNRQFFGFNCANKLSYDPLSSGGYTELKDKIICLKDQWENDYYRSIAEDYLQTTMEVLLKSGMMLDLKAVVDCLDYKRLVKIVYQTQDQNLMARVNSLGNYDRKDITGLQAHLNILIHSELGEFFEKNDSTFSLSDVIDKNGVVYFALPALRFPSFSKVLGKLVINDIKAIIDRKNGKDLPVFTVFDEFSVFAGEQVLNLVNMGRGKGIHAVFGTQGLADLDKIDVTFKNQVLNCANTLICHRLNDQDSAETVANWIGTKDTFTVTAQLNINQGDAGLGSVRKNKEFIIHPDAIKQELNTGEAFYVTKAGRFRQDKVVVKFN